MYLHVFPFSGDFRLKVAQTRTFQKDTLESTSQWTRKVTWRNSWHKILKILPLKIIKSNFKKEINQAQNCINMILK